MPDPLSITVSITALLHVTKSIISSLRAVRAAPDDQVKFTSEKVSELDVLLTRLQAHAKQARPEDSWFATVLAHSDGPLDQLESHLAQLESKLELATGRLEGFNKMVSWIFNKTEIVDILSKIERTKTFFILLLTVDLL